MQGAFPLSLTLPLEDGTHPFETVLPWLANLLPEEEQLFILTKSLGLYRAETLAVLNEIGGDTAGALSFGVRSDRSAWACTPLAELHGVDDPEIARAS